MLGFLHILMQRLKFYAVSFHDVITVAEVLLAFMYWLVDLAWFDNSYIYIIDVLI